MDLMDPVVPMDQMDLTDHKVIQIKINNFEIINFLYSTGGYGPPGPTGPPEPSGNY